jgi:hypothetical protein
MADIFDDTYGDQQGNVMGMDVGNSQPEPEDLAVFKLTLKKKKKKKKPKVVVAAAAAAPGVTATDGKKQVAWQGSDRYVQLYLFEKQECTCPLCLVLRLCLYFVYCVYALMCSCLSMLILIHSLTHSLILPPLSLPTHSDYTYAEMLDRVYQQILEKNPNLQERKRHSMPPPSLNRVGTKKTMWNNFAQICKIMKRTQAHVQSFFVAELGTRACVCVCVILMCA